MIYVYVFLLLFCFYRCCCCYCWVQGICMSSGKKHHAVKAAVWYTYRLWWTRWAPCMIADTKTYNILRFIKIYNPWQSCWNIVLKQGNFREQNNSQPFSSLLFKVGVLFCAGSSNSSTTLLEGGGEGKAFSFFKLAKSQRGPSGKRVSTNFVPDCSLIYV